MNNTCSERMNFNIYLNKPLFIIKCDNNNRDKSASNCPKKSKIYEPIINNNNFANNTNLNFSINNNIDKTCPYYLSFNISIKIQYGKTCTFNT